jgi:hypothetical protein
MLASLEKKDTPYERELLFSALRANWGAPPPNPPGVFEEEKRNIPLLCQESFYILLVRYRLESR